MTMLELAERVAFTFSTPLVQECVNSLRGGGDWKVRPNGEVHRTKPYPMGFYPDDPRLYYARGWGCSETMWPHERWLVRRTAALRAHSSQETQPAQGEQS